MTREGPIAARARARQRGAGTVEYVGALLVVGMLMTALLVTGSCTPHRAPPVPDLDRIRSLVAPSEVVPTPPRTRPPSSAPRPRPPRRPKQGPGRPRVEVPRWAIGR